MGLTERQLTRAIYSLWDFQQALSSLSFLLEEWDAEERYTRVEMRRFRCYETAMIIALARPFETSRGATALSLNAMGIKLSPEERALLNQVMQLRRKVIAHSDEEQMNFRASTFPVQEFNFPRLQFNEELHLKPSVLRQYETLLRRLVSDMAGFFWTLAQHDPGRMDFYMAPGGLGDVR